ncbi:MAG: hypothetical protein ABI068_02425 [Ktedonobacterales bacterium]
MPSPNTSVWRVCHRRSASAQAGTLNYLASDGLGSVSEALDGSGNVTAAQLYTPYGQTRYTSGTMPTSKGFTGQRAMQWRHDLTVDDATLPETLQFLRFAIEQSEHAGRLR